MEARTAPFNVGPSLPRFSGGKGRLLSLLINVATVLEVLILILLKYTPSICYLVLVTSDNSDLYRAFAYVRIIMNEQLTNCRIFPYQNKIRLFRGS